VICKKVNHPSQAEIIPDNMADLIFENKSMSFTILAQK
jgi:hypothetical protein